MKRGERALMLCVSITRKRRDEDADEEQTFTSFIYTARWFVLTQTEGQQLEPITIPEWDAERAIAALSIESAFHSITRTEMFKGFRAYVVDNINRTYVAKSVMWRRVIPPRKHAVSSICTPHKFHLYSRIVLRFHLEVRLCLTNFTKFSAHASAI